MKKRGEDLQKPKHRFILSGGGTGGHIFPAISIADALKSLAPESEILFVGAKGKMEMTKVPEAGYPIKGLWISGVHRGELLRNIFFPLKLLWSLLQSLVLVIRFRPDCVVGTGGYASGPVLWMAQLFGKPTMVQEQNAFAGITNKLLGKKVKRAFVAFEDMQRFFKPESIRIFGNPVRTSMFRNLPGKKESLKHFSFQKQLPVVLVTGGSQGALGINEAIKEGISGLKSAEFNLIWQTGPSFEKRAAESIPQSLKDSVYVSAFIKEMDKAISAADIVITRSGASIISELAVASRAAIFVPLPTAAENHQFKNAEALVKEGAALLVDQRHAKERLIPTALDLLANASKRNLLSDKIAAFARPNAANDIAAEILELLKSGKS